MKDLMILFGEVLPTETIIDQIEEAIQKYKSDPTDEALKGVEMFCVLLLSKMAAKAAGGAEELIRKTDLQQKGYDLLNQTKQ